MPQNNSEKILKLDAENKQYSIVVIGEESHVAYNRVGLTSFFEHRKVEELYLNPREWVCALLVDLKIVVSSTNPNSSTTLVPMSSTTNSTPK